MSLAGQVDALATRVGTYLRDSVLPRLLPSGGVAGQVLAKSSDVPYAVSWVSSGASVYTVTVDFGTGLSSYRVRTFNVSLAAATVVGGPVIATPALDTVAGVSADEFEVDPFVVAARVSSVGVVQLTVASLAGPLSRQRRINILLG